MITHPSGSRFAQMHEIDEQCAALWHGVTSSTDPKAKGKKIAAELCPRRLRQLIAELVAMVDF
jgi:hypothetical protein